MTQKVFLFSSETITEALATRPVWAEVRHRGATHVCIVHDVRQHNGFLQVQTIAGWRTPVEVWHFPPRHALPMPQAA